MLNGPIKTKFATYGDIFNTFVAPLISEITDIPKDMPVYLFHKDDSYFDNNRCITVKEINDGLVFYIITLENFKNYREFYIGDYSKITDTDSRTKWRDSIKDVIAQRNQDNKTQFTYFGDEILKDINTSTLLKDIKTPSGFVAQIKNIIDKSSANLPTNSWLKTYKQTITNPEFLLDNSGEHNTNKLVIGMRKFKDSTITARAVIEDTAKAELVDIQDFIDKVFISGNIDSLFVPITLTNVQAIPMSYTDNHRTNENSLIQLCDLQKIGMFSLQRGTKTTPSDDVFPDFVFNESTDLTSNTYDYNEFLSQEILDKMIEFNNINVTDSSIDFSKYKQLYEDNVFDSRKNAYKIKSFYSDDESEKMSYYLSSLLLSSRQTFTSEARDILKNQKWFEQLQTGTTLAYLDDDQVASQFKFLPLTTYTTNAIAPNLGNGIYNMNYFGNVGFNYRAKSNDTSTENSSTNTETDSSTNDNVLTVTNTNENDLINLFASTEDSYDYISQAKGIGAAAKQTLPIVAGRTITTASTPSLSIAQKTRASFDTRFDRHNIIVGQMELIAEKPISLDEIIYSNNREALNDAGAYIVPFKKNNKYYEKYPIYEVYLPLNINTVVGADMYDWLLPVFNGPNYNPGKRSAVFTLTQDRTNAKAQIVIDQYGPPLNIKLYNFSDDFCVYIENPSIDSSRGEPANLSSFLYEQYNELTKNSSFINIGFQKNATENSKELSDAFIVTTVISAGLTNDDPIKVKEQDGSKTTTVGWKIPIKKINVSIIYNSYNMIIPNDMKYITMTLNSSWFIPKEKIQSIEDEYHCDVKVEYDGIVLETRTWNRPIFEVNSNIDANLNKAIKENSEIYTDKTDSPEFDSSSNIYLYPPGDLLYTYWKYNRTATNTGESIGLENLIGEPPAIWAQNNIFLVLYKQKF